MYLRYAFYAAIALIAFIFTYITCPLWALIAAITKAPSLPGVLALLHTHDDNVYGAHYRMSQYHETDAVPETFIKRFKSACWWIWRNPNYGFNSEVLGLPVDGTKITLDVQEGVEGDYTRWTLFNRDGTKYFGYAANIPYTKTKYIKMWFGWQWHPLDNSNKYMLKFAFNPFRTRGDA